MLEYKFEIKTIKEKYKKFFPNGSIVDRISTIEKVNDKNIVFLSKYYSIHLPGYPDPEFTHPPTEEELLFDYFRQVEDMELKYVLEELSKLKEVEKFNSFEEFYDLYHKSMYCCGPCKDSTFIVSKSLSDKIIEKVAATEKKIFSSDSIDFFKSWENNDPSSIKLFDFAPPIYINRTNDINLRFFGPAFVNITKSEDEYGDEDGFPYLCDRKQLWSLDKQKIKIRIDLTKKFVLNLNRMSKHCAKINSCPIDLY